jgi:hypothetical protein
MALTDDQLRVLTEMVGRETDGERGSVGGCIVAVGFETGEEPSREDVEAALVELRK